LKLSSLKKSMIKPFFLIIIPVLILILIPSLTLATPSPKTEKTKTELNKIVAKYNSERLTLQKLDEEVIKTKNLLKDTESNLNKSVQDLNTRIVGLYKEDNFSSAIILLTSSDIHEFFFRLEALLRVSGKDAELIENLKNSQSKIQFQLENLEKNYECQEKLVAQTNKLSKKLKEELNKKDMMLPGIANESEISENMPSRGKNRSSSNVIEKGWASWYGIPGLTAAHKTLPKGTRVKVTNLLNGKQVTVKIIDRGPYVKGRVIDLSKTAFSKIFPPSRGLCYVSLEVL